MFVFVREEMNLRENLVRQRDSCDIELGNSFIFSQNEHQIVLKFFLEMVLICRSDFKDSFHFKFATANSVPFFVYIWS